MSDSTDGVVQGPVVDPTWVAQANVTAINDLPEGGTVEYWVIRSPDTGTEAVIVGRAHDALTYRVMQTAEIESSGWIEIYDGCAYAADPSVLAAALLGALGGQTRFGTIVPWAPPRTTIDFATISALNQANIKATSDGGSVVFSTVRTPTGIVLLIGGGHPSDFGPEAQPASAGVIRVTKGRLFDAGTLNVIGAAADEQWNIKAYLNEFSDKEVVFDDAG